MAPTDLGGDLDKIYGLARLHGWCTQVEDSISALRERVGSAPELATEYAGGVRSRMDAATSREEKVLSLVLLRDAGAAAQDLAELSYQHLNGKLTDEDFLFCSRQFYHGVPPVPEQITYDIMERDFISYQRALYQAMRISEFTSQYAPPDVVLFFTMLLCLTTLDRQNRAMVYLLLSRIDCPLPSGVEKAVTAGLRALRDVIHEVESRREAVLSDTLHLAKSEPTGYAWDTPRKPAAAPAEPSGSPATQGGDRAEHRRADFGPREAVGLTGDAMPLSVAPVASRAQPYPERPDFGPRKARTAPEGAEPATVASPVAPLLSSSKAPAGERKGSRTRRAAPTEGGPSGVAASSVEDGEARGTKESASPTPAAEPERAARGRRRTTARRAAEAAILEAGQSQPRGRIAEAGRLFTISFARQTAELAAVLEALKGRVGEAASGEGETEGATRGAALRLWIERSWWILVVAAALLAGLLALLLVHPWTPRDHPEETPEAPVVAAAAAPAPAVAVRDEPAPVAPGGPVVEMRGTRLVWYPRKGDSLWSLYSYLRAARDDRFGLAALAARGWGGFLSEVTRLNPQIKLPSLIYPEGPILLRAESRS